MSTQRAARARLRSITSCQTKDTVTGFDIRLRRTPLNAAGGEGGPDSYTGRKKKQLEDGKRSRSFSSESTLNLLEADGKLTQAIRETVQRDCDTPHATATSRTLYILHNNTKHVQHQGEMNSILLLFHFTLAEKFQLQTKTKHLKGNFQGILANCRRVCGLAFLKTGTSFPPLVR